MTTTVDRPRNQRRPSDRPRRRPAQSHRRRALRGRCAGRTSALRGGRAEHDLTRAHRRHRRSRGPRGRRRRRGADVPQRAAHHDDRLRFQRRLVFSRARTDAAADRRRALLGSARRGRDRENARSRDDGRRAAAHHLPRRTGRRRARRANARAQGARRDVLRLARQRRTRRRRCRAESGPDHARRDVHDAGPNAQRDGTVGDRRRLVGRRADRLRRDAVDQRHADDAGALLRPQARSGARDLPVHRRRLRLQGLDLAAHRDRGDGGEGGQPCGETGGRPQPVLHLERAPLGNRTAHSHRGHAVRRDHRARARRARHHRLRRRLGRAVRQIHRLPLRDSRICG